MKPRFYIIIGGLLLLAVIIAAAASSAPPNKLPTPTPAPVTTPATTTPVAVTINSEVGVKQVTITNLNSGTSITKRSTDLPFTFNAKTGDSLRFYVVTEENYLWNAWVFHTGTFDNHNPLTIKVASDMEMSPQCLVQEAPIE